MNDTCLEKLCGIAVAAGVVAVSAAGNSVVPGLLEGLTAAGGLFLGVRSGREADCRRVLDKVKREVADGYRAWIAVEHRDQPWYHQANLDNAITELERVIDHCVPSPQDMVGVDLNGDDLASLLLERAARHSPIFREGGPNPAASAIFRTIVRTTYERVRTNPNYAATLRTYIDEELLGRTRDLLAGQRQADAKLDAILAAVSVERSVPLPVLREILVGFGEQAAALDPATIEARLRAKADEYQSLAVRLNRLTNDDPEVQVLRRAAAALIEAGAFEAADLRLADAEARDLAVVEELESLAARRRLSAAKTRAERGATARLRLDYRAAAGHYGEAATLVPAVERESRWRCLLAQAAALYAQGDEFGDNAALGEAILVSQQALDLVPRARYPLAWAATQNNLGAALRTLGEREVGTERLKGAEAAFRAALLELTREHAPDAWAAAHNNLGTVLASLDNREEATGRLMEAVMAFRAALEQYTREQTPFDWAMTQTNLGNTLVLLDQSDTETRHLEAAVTAYRAALTEYTREQTPLEWAATQNNLGNALQELGEREAGVGRFEEAADAFRASQLERTRERAPLDWAMAQNNLGNVFRMLGERGAGIGRLEEAAAAYEAALEMFKAAKASHYVEAASVNIAMVRRLLAERQAGG